MNKKKITVITAVVLLAALVSGAALYTIKNGTTPEDMADIQKSQEAEKYRSDVISSKEAEQADTIITLSDEGSECNNPKVSVNGKEVLITSAGTYKIQGTLSNGQVHINTENGSDMVKLIFDGVNLTNEDDAAIYAENGKCTVFLTENTTNIITSGKETEITDKTASDDASGGTMLFKDDVIFCGEGPLEVYGYINNGIHASDSLYIYSGNIRATAVKHAIRANDSLDISGGNLVLTSGQDGLHSEDSLVINDGNILISACDDAIHAENTLLIQKGAIVISKSDEGIEACQITVNGGDISVVSSDDGFNANGGSDNKKTENVSNLTCLTINGGNIFVNASGDGLDSNGNLYINGGYIIVDGPSNSANGALDAGTESGGILEVNGGTLLAIGDAGMAEVPGNTSTQPCFSITASYQAGDVINISKSDGTEIITYTTLKKGASIICSSPEFSVGDTVIVKVNDTTYDVELTDIITGSGNHGFGPGGGFRPGEGFVPGEGNEGGQRPERPGGNINPGVPEGPGGNRPPEGGMTPPDGSMEPPDGNLEPPEPGEGFETPPTEEYILPTVPDVPASNDDPQI